MNNFIEEYKNALPSDICDFLIEKFEENINLAQQGRVGGGRINSKVKSTLDLCFLSLIEAKKISKKEHSNIISSITDTLQEKLKEYFVKYGMNNEFSKPKDEQLKRPWTSENFEEKYVWNNYVIEHAGVHMKKYLPGKNYYHWHVDTANDRPDTFARKLVMMFYLNDVEEGGETGFFNQNLEIKPTKGTLVIFPACFTGKHRGKTPKSGVKYIINSWLVQIIEPLVPHLIKNNHRFLCLNKRIKEEIAREKYKNN